MPGTFRDELFNSVRGGFCQALQLQRNYYGWVGRNPFFITGRLAQGFMDAAYRLMCNQEPPPPPDPDFTGGQCDNVSYDVTVTYEVRQSGSVLDADTRLLRVNGKVNGLRPVLDNDEPGTSYQIQLLVDPANNGGIDFVNVTAGSGGGPYTSTQGIDSIVRTDGAPDTCGDPPPPIPEPEPGFNEPNVPVVYSPDFGPDITIPLVFIFAPVRVNLTGNLTVPVRINLGGINPQFNGDLNLNQGDLNLNFGNPNYNRDGLPNPDGYEAPTDTPDVPDDVPDDVPNPPPISNDDVTTRILRACIVTVTSVSPAISEIYQDDNPNIYAPNLGYVNFAVNVGGTISWTSDIPVKNRRNFISCEWEGGAVSVRGTPRPGVAWTIRPVYALVEDAVEFA